MTINVDKYEAFPIYLYMEKFTFDPFTIIIVIDSLLQF